MCSWTVENTAGGGSLRKPNKLNSDIKCETADGLRDNRFLGHSDENIQYLSWKSGAAMIVY